MAAPKTETPKAPAKDKSAAFVKLANARVSTAINKISIIGNLANTNSYDFTLEQIAVIEKALHGNVDLVIKKFADAKNGKKVTQGNFSL